MNNKGNPFVRLYSLFHQNKCTAKQLTRWMRKLSSRIGEDSTGYAFAAIFEMPLEVRLKLADSLIASDKVNRSNINA